MSIEDKLTAIAENVPKVYEAGYEKGKMEGGGVGIDDSVVSADSAWSSKNTVDKLCPPISESGSIVTCEPVEGYPLEVVSHIEPIQEGKGVPSPLIYQELPDAVASEGITMACTTVPLESGTSYRLSFVLEDDAGNIITPTGVHALNLDTDEEFEGTLLDGHFDFTCPSDGMFAFGFGGVDAAITSHYTLFIYDPGNIRPIKPRKAVNVWHGGKNLLPYPYFETTKTHNGVTFTDNGDGSITINGISSKPYNTVFYMSQDESILKDGVTYCLPPAQGNIQFRFAYRDTEGNYKNPITPLTWNKDYKNLQVMILISSSAEISDITVYPQLEVGETPTAYEPYHGDTFTIDLGQDVYGGSFNCATGELVIDRKMITLDGSEVWGSGSTGTAGLSRYRLTKTDNPTLLGNIKLETNTAAKDEKLLCSKLPTISANAGWKCTDGIYAESVYAINAFCNQYATDINAFKEVMKGAQIVFGLENPITVQLTRQEILALSGENTLYSDTGDTTVTGRADPNAVIQDLYNKLNALSATMTALTGV